MHVLSTDLISPEGRFLEGTPLSELPEALAKEAADLRCVREVPDPPGPAPEPPSKPEPEDPEPSGVVELLDGHWRLICERIEAGELDHDLPGALAHESAKDKPRKSIVGALERRQAGG